MNIRKYNNFDKEALVSFWSKVFPDDPPHNEPGKVIAEKLIVDDLIFIVEEEDNIIGACMAGYDGHRGWLYAVAVGTEFRRKGVGKKLVSNVLASLRELGCGKVNIQIRAKNDQAEEFYKSIGFNMEDRVSMGVHLAQSNS